MTTFESKTPKTKGPTPYFVLAPLLLVQSVAQQNQRRTQINYR